MGALGGLVRYFAKTVTKRVEGHAEPVIPKYNGVPSWIRDNPEFMTKWTRKKMAAWAKDEQNGWLTAPKVSLDDKRAWIKDLPHDKHVSPEYVSDLVRVAHEKVELKTIVAYLKSQAADNIGNYERAQMIAQCFEKIRILDILHMIH